MHDTSPEAVAVVRAAVQRRPPVQRMRDALELSESLRALALARLRRQHPADSPIALAERLTGESLQLAARTGPPRAP
jgi:hypothetical protein